MKSQLFVEAVEAVQAKQLQMQASLIRRLSLAEVRWINIISCKKKDSNSSPHIVSQEIEKNKTKYLLVL